MENDIQKQILKNTIIKNLNKIFISNRYSIKYPWNSHKKLIEMNVAFANYSNLFLETQWLTMLNKQKSSADLEGLIYW